MSGRKRTIIYFLSPKPKVDPSSNPSPTPSTPVSPLNSKSNTPTKSTSMQISGVFRGNPGWFPPPFLKKLKFIPNDPYVFPKFFEKIFQKL